MKDCSYKPTKVDIFLLIQSSRKNMISHQ